MKSLKSLPSQKNKTGLQTHLHSNKSALKKYLKSHIFRKGFNTVTTRASVFTSMLFLSQQTTEKSEWQYW